MTEDREKEVEAIAKAIHTSYKPRDLNMTFKDTDWHLAKKLTWAKPNSANAIKEDSPCLHKWGTDGQHSQEFCKKCFINKPL